MAALIGFAIVGTRDLKQAPQGLKLIYPINVSETF